MEYAHKYAQEFLQGTADHIVVKIRTEVNYAASTIRSSIEEGIKAGFDSVRKALFYLMIATASTIVALIFMMWGLAKIFAEYFRSEGTGFLVFGLILFLIGMLSFSMSRPK